MTKRLMQGFAATLFGLLGFVSGANAVLISMSSGGLAASADFAVVGGNLQVVLTNTSLSDVLVPGNVLMAVFFDLNGVGVLTPLSATVSGGSTVQYGSFGAGGVGAGWAYKGSLSGLPGGASEGISAAGYSSPSFGPNGNFGCGANCVAVNGLDYGLLSAGDNTATGNGGVTGHGPLIQNSVTFLLSGLPGGFTDEDLNLTNVTFQYGTALANCTGADCNPEPCIGACQLATVPEPNMPLLIGTALVGWAVVRRRFFGRA
jgi:hypothetical protein